MAAEKNPPDFPPEGAELDQVLNRLERLCKELLEASNEATEQAREASRLNQAGENCAEAQRKCEEAHARTLALNCEFHDLSKRRAELRYLIDRAVIGGHRWALAEARRRWQERKN